MAYCVFMHRTDSIYDDSPAEKYQFPKQYLSRAEPSVGSWVLYLEPTKVRDSRGYFAVARLQTIIPDPTSDGMYLALIEPSSYLDFPTPVGFSDQNGPLEHGLLNSEGRISGRAQAAVRPISASDFDRIVSIGLGEEGEWPDRVDAPVDEYDQRNIMGFGEEAQLSLERPMVQMISNRKIRDAKFKLHVRKVYDRRCAFTGLRLINGKGRPEVEAAHIVPVANNGPDSIRNGIALSGTVHWMFDRGLLSLSNEFEILQSRHLNHDLSSLLVRDNKAIVPQNPALQPHPEYLGWHRENIFKQ